MSNLDKLAIKDLIKLSRIECSEAEQDALLKDLEKILAYIEQLQELDTTGVEPCNQVLAGAANVMRADEIGETMPRELFLSNAPAQIGGMIKVPPVMKTS